MKIVINRCYGGFGLSDAADQAIGVGFNGDRTDPRLISVVEELGPRANGEYSKLKIVEIPDSATDWEIGDCGGSEYVTYVVDGKLHHVF